MKKNRCPPTSNMCRVPHLDIAVPGFDHFDYSEANVCGMESRATTGGWSVQPTKRDESHASYALGDWYRRYSSTAAAAGECDALPEDFRRGCRLFAAWGWREGDPYLDYKPVACPAAMIAHYSNLFGRSGPINHAPPPPPPRLPRPPPPSPPPPPRPRRRRRGPRRRRRRRRHPRLHRRRRHCRRGPRRRRNRRRSPSPSPPPCAWRDGLELLCGKACPDGVAVWCSEYNGDAASCNNAYAQRGNSFYGRCEYNGGSCTLEDNYEKLPRPPPPSPPPPSPSPSPPRRRRRRLRRRRPRPPPHHPRRRRPRPAAAAAAAARRADLSDRTQRSDCRSTPPSPPSCDHPRRRRRRPDPPPPTSRAPSTCRPRSAGALPRAGEACVLGLRLVRVARVR